MGNGRVCWGKGKERAKEQTHTTHLIFRGLEPCSYEEQKRSKQGKARANLFPNSQP